MLRNTLFILAVTLLLGLPSALRAQTTPSDFQKGMSAYNLGDYQQALDDFGAALEEDPNSWEAYQQEGYCYFHLGQLKKMKAAFDESLKLHPDNPELKDFIKHSTKINSPKKPSSQPKSTPQVTPVPNRTKGQWGSSWLNLSGGLNYGFFDELTAAANIWNQVLAQYHAPGDASVANFGYQVDLEYGLALDKTNTFSFQTGFEAGHGFQEHLVYSSPVTENISPKLIQFGLNYYHYFPSENDRFFLTCGVLYGIALVDYYQDDPTITISGPLSGSSIGFILGAGKEWKISNNMGLQFGGRFRYLSVSQIQNNFSAPAYGVSGKLVLAVDSLGDLGLTTPQSIGQNGLKYATMDYTGFNMNFSLNFYFF